MIEAAADSRENTKGSDEGEIAQSDPETYAPLVASYAVGVGTFLLYRRTTGRGLPERISMGDLALGAVASHKASRIIGKDKVTAFMRRPFATYDESGTPGEVEDSPRGHGVRRAIGELVVCPYCLDQWTATACVVGLITAPRLTRFLASTLAMVTASDFLQLAYQAAQNRA